MKGNNSTFTPLWIEGIVNWVGWKQGRWLHLFFELVGLNLRCGSSLSLPATRCSLKSTQNLWLQPVSVLLTRLYNTEITAKIIHIYFYRGKSGCGSCSSELSPAASPLLIYTDFTVRFWPKWLHGKMDVPKVLKVTRNALWIWRPGPEIGSWHIVASGPSFRPGPVVSAELSGLSEPDHSALGEKEIPPAPSFTGLEPVALAMREEVGRFNKSYQSYIQHRSLCKPPSNVQQCMDPLCSVAEVGWKEPRGTSLSRHIQFWTVVTPPLTYVDTHNLGLSRFLLKSRNQFRTE